MNSPDGGRDFSVRTASLFLVFFLLFLVFIVYFPCLIFSLVENHSMCCLLFLKAMTMLAVTTSGIIQISKD